MPRACEKPIGDAILDDVVVYRLVKADWIKPTDMGIRPSSQAFSNTKEDGRMSVYLSDSMSCCEKTVDDLLALWPGYRVCYFLASKLREFGKFGQEIARAPEEDFPGHALVEHKGSARRPDNVKQAMSLAAKWCE